MSERLTPACFYESRSIMINNQALSSTFADSRNGSSDLVDMPAGTVPNLGAVAGVGGEDMASLWASYAMGLKKTPPPASAATPSRSDRDRESSPPGGEGTGSAHDETSSSGNKDDEDDDDEDADERLDPRHHDPERQKAFNVSSRSMSFHHPNLDVDGLQNCSNSSSKILESVESLETFSRLLGS